MIKNISKIIQEIKDMNTVFERPEAMWVDRKNEFSYFQEELDELKKSIKQLDLVEVIDALVDIGVFGVGALHKDGKDTDTIKKDISIAHYIDIHTISDYHMYQDNIRNIIHSALVSLSSILGIDRVYTIFHEVYLSNMSKLKDGKPVPWWLPWKFGKNMDTYFSPDIKKYLST